MIAFETMQKCYLYRDVAAREFKRKGGKVVGYFCNSVPEELITAAGFLPVRLTGHPLADTDLADRYLEYYYCPFYRSTYNMLLAGKYDFLDFLIVPHTCDAVYRGFYYLGEEKRIDPSLKIPELYAFDVLSTRYRNSYLYFCDRVRALKEKLEELSGNKISKESLLRAIALHNENRILLKKIAELRTGDSPVVSGVQALQIIGAGFFIKKEEHNRLLQEFIGHSDQLPVKEGTRLFVSGSCVDNLQLYELIESCGATIVSEDVCTGSRYSDNLVDPKLDPIEAIAERYLLKSPCGFKYPLDKIAEYTSKKASEAKCQGVIFNFLKWCDSMAWNYPEQRRLLDEIGIPHLVFEMQEYYLSAPQSLRTRIEAFLESIQEKTFCESRARTS